SEDPEFVLETRLPAVGPDPALPPDACRVAAFALPWEPPVACPPVVPAPVPPPPPPDGPMPAPKRSPCPPCDPEPPCVADPPASRRAWSTGSAYSLPAGLLGSMWTPGSAAAAAGTQAPV